MKTYPRESPVHLRGKFILEAVRGITGIALLAGLLGFLDLSLERSGSHRWINSAMLDMTRPPGNFPLGLLFTPSVLTALGSEIPWKQFLGVGDWPTSLPPFV